MTNMERLIEDRLVGWSVINHPSDDMRLYGLHVPFRALHDDDHLAQGIADDIRHVGRVRESNRVSLHVHEMERTIYFYI